MTMERNTAGNRTEQEIKTVTFNVQDRMTSMAFWVTIEAN